MPLEPHTEFGLHHNKNQVGKTAAKPRQFLSAQ